MTSALPRLTVMSFNIRYDEPADGVHAWNHRREIAIASIRAVDPDLLGLQEPMPDQWEDIASSLPDRTPFGVIADDEGAFDPQGGFIRKARFEVRETGLFWLSETSHVAGSVSWPNDWGPRACGWIRLHDRLAARDFVFACTHFDTNAGAWLPSARVLHAELDRAAADQPVILVGDFNCAAGSEPHRYLREDAGYRDAWNDAGHTDEGIVTFQGFTRITRLPEGAGELRAWLAHTSGGIDKFDHYADHVKRHGNYRIDWILVRGPLRCIMAAVPSVPDSVPIPSDHHPVTAVVEWQD